MSPYSQLLLQALELALECVNVLRLSFVGRTAGVRQLRQTVHSLLQLLHICHQLRDLDGDTMTQRSTHTHTQTINTNGTA